MQNAKVKAFKRERSETGLEGNIGDGGGLEGVGS